MYFLLKVVFWKTFEFKFYFLFIEMGLRIQKEGTNVLSMGHVSAFSPFGWGISYLYLGSACGS